MHPTRQVDGSYPEERRLGFETEGPLSTTQINFQRNVRTDGIRPSLKSPADLSRDGDVEAHHFNDGQPTVQVQVNRFRPNNLAGH